MVPKSKEPLSPQFMIDDTSLRLPETQYYPGDFPKKRLGLHHTVGGSAASTYDWWMKDKTKQGKERRVGTAYQIPRGGGTVYEHFPPAAMAWAWGLEGLDRPARTAWERATLNIELSSEGGLQEREGHLYAFGSKNLGEARKLLKAGKVVHFPAGWRGFEWFDEYDEGQLETLYHLIAFAVSNHSIARQLPPLDVIRGDADPAGFMDFEGILPHTVMRSDKSDLHPGFPWERLQELLGNG